MYENIDELVNLHLDELFNSLEKSSWIFTLKDDKGIPIRDQLKFARYLEDKKLVEIEPTKRKRIDITKFGYEVSLKGGWLEHLKTLKCLKEEQHLKIQIKEQEEVVSSKKLANEYILSKWKRKTFWVFFGFAIFSGLYSSYDIISNLTKTEIPKENIVTKQQMEFELSKLRTLILKQNSLDSLRSSIIHSNSKKIK